MATDLLWHSSESYPTKIRLLPKSPQGSNPEETISSIDGKKSNRENEIDDSKASLDDCHEECDPQGCYGKGPMKCVSCRNKRLDRTCVRSCPPRSFADAHGVCQPCHESCDTCTGPGQDNCMTCAPAHVKVIDLDICMQQCPEGYYEDFQHRTCIPCQPNCASCLDRPDYCTSCDHHLAMYQNKCYASCPINTFESEDYRCLACHSSCETCKGPNDTQCISCPAGSLEHKGHCKSSCPPNHFSDSQARECVACHNGCSTCNRTMCHTCLTNWTLSDKGICLPNKSNRCDGAEYLEDGNCKPCHSTCETCNGPTENACLSCNSPFILQNDKCVAACEKGFYLGPNAAMCSTCQHSCSSCTTKRNCTECFSGLHLQNGECLATCVQGYYSDRGVCEKCYISCESCSGPRQDQCVTCPAGWQLAAGECHPDCPDGFYKTEFGCQKCHHYCRNCIDGCKNQADKRRINVEAYLYSPQPMSSLQLINPFNLVTGLAVIACVCIIALFVAIFVALQRNSWQSNGSAPSYSKVSIRKPKVTCNYKVVSVNEGDTSDTDNSEVQQLVTPSKQRSEC